MTNCCTPRQLVTSLTEYGDSVSHIRLVACDKLAVMNQLFRINRCVEGSTVINSFSYPINRCVVSEGGAAIDKDAVCALSHFSRKEVD